MEDDREISGQDTKLGSIVKTEECTKMSRTEEAIHLGIMC